MFTLNCDLNFSINRIQVEVEQKCADLSKRLLKGGVLLRPDGLVHVTLGPVGAGGHHEGLVVGDDGGESRHQGVGAQEPLLPPHNHHAVLSEDYHSQQRVRPYPDSLWRETRTLFPTYSVTI